MVMAMSMTVAMPAVAATIAEAALVHARAVPAIEIEAERNVIDIAHRRNAANRHRLSLLRRKCASQKQGRASGDEGHQFFHWVVLHG
jgi:hypothetical protein